VGRLFLPTFVSHNKNKTVMSQSRRLKREQQRKTNKTFVNNLNTHKIEGRRLGVLAVFDTGNAITPFRVVVPYDGVSVYPTDTEDEFKSNIGMLFYGFNYYDEIKHLQNITHAGFTEALSMGVGAFARFTYEQQPNDIFNEEDLGVIIHFKFNKLGNCDYEISSPLDSVCLGFDEWIKMGDKIKLALASNLEKGNKIVENQVISI